MLTTAKIYLEGATVLSSDKDFIFSIIFSIFPGFIHTLSVDNPIIVLIITLILTMHQARGCPAPPNLKNSINSKRSQQTNNKVKGTIILPILSSIIMNKN